MRYDIPSPMLAKAAASVPDPAKTTGGLLFEPKWDGFRGLISWDGETVEIGSRGAKPLTRYFPELVEAIPRVLPGPCLLDGEIVVATGPDGAQRLDWEALSQRIHPAASRVAKLGRDARDVHRVRPARPRRRGSAEHPVRRATRAPRVAIRN